jgi:uncharacterized membrane protein YcfT
LLTAFVSGAALWADGDWTTTHASSYRDLNGRPFVTAWLAGTWHSAPLTTVHFWNHSTRGAVALVAPLVGFLGLFLVLPQRLFLARYALALRLVGRHALLVYVFHLCALGALDAFGLVPQSAAASWGLVLVLFCLGTVLAAARERIPRRPRPA